MVTVGTLIDETLMRRCWATITDRWITHSVITQLRLFSTSPEYVYVITVHIRGIVSPIDRVADDFLAR